MNPVQFEVRVLNAQESLEYFLNTGVFTLERDMPGTGGASIVMLRTINGIVPFELAIAQPHESRLVAWTITKGVQVTLYCKDFDVLEETYRKVQKTAARVTRFITRPWGGQFSLFDANDNEFRFLDTPHDQLEGHVKEAQIAEISKKYKEREATVKSIQVELASLNNGISHPDTTAELFIYHVVTLEENGLLGFAPPEIRKKIDDILNDFERDGYRHAYNGKGTFLDLTMETKSLLKIVRGKERAAILHLGPHCECGFCSKQFWADGSTVVAAGKILQEPHEGATFGFCDKCERPYLMYWVESRDEIYRYHCPLSNDDYGRLREMVASEKVMGSELLGFIRATEVFFVSPRESKWVNGGRVLVEPRPW